MTIDWNELQKEMYPIRSYEDLSRRWKEAVEYAFVRKYFNFSMTAMADYALRLLGGDTRNRYAEWMNALISTFSQLDKAGVKDLLDLVQQVNTQVEFEGFVALTGIGAKELINILKYLVYWFIPAKKNMKGLVKNDPQVLDAILKLRSCGISSNLDLLDKGITAEARKVLAKTCGLPETAVIDLVNRADFSRMPWVSAATISNFLGAGYGSIARLANANFEQLSADFYRYGESIGKNFKFGSEIDNSHRIAKIVPKVVNEETSA